MTRSHLLFLILAGMSTLVGCRQGHGYTDLQLAVMGGDQDKVQEALDSGADPNPESRMFSPFSVTPLIVAARSGDLKIVRMLVEAGADVNHASREMTRTPLTVAAREGHTEVARVLSRHGARQDATDWMGTTALEAAAWSCHPATVRLLLEDASANQSRINLNGALRYAAGINATETGKRRGKIDKRSGVKESGVAGGGPAQTAGESVAIVRMLLEAGADVNGSTGSTKVTPLMAAADAGNAEILQILLQTGADVDAADSNGNTALMDASLRGYEAIVQQLLDAGANVDMVARRGRTALLSACLWGKAGVVDQLLSAGADPNARSSRGYTPLDLATSRKHTPVVELLKAAGATE